MIEVKVVVGRGTANERTFVIRVDRPTLLAFTPAERHALIDAVALDEKLGGSRLDPLVTEATPSTVHEVLRARVAQPRITDEHEAILDEPDGRVQLAAWMAEYGSDNQKARQREGLLPPREAIATLRNWLFADLDAQLERIEPLKPQQVCSWKRPRCSRCPGRVELESRPCQSPIVAEQFDSLDQLRQRVANDGRVELREHLGSCSGCTCRLRRVSARVIRRWHGYELAREYVLSGARADAAEAAR